MRKIFIEIICLLFVLIFLYTAASKFFDYSNFRAVIGQSPIITKFSYPLSIAVPLLEIIISILLIVPRYRLVGLFFTFSIMVLFTVYIIALVTLSEKIPCSCGGVISKMSWDQHLYFNVFLIILATIGVFLEAKKNEPEMRKRKALITA